MSAGSHDAVRDLKVVQAYKNAVITFPMKNLSQTGYRPPWKTGCHSSLPVATAAGTRRAGIDLDVTYYRKRGVGRHSSNIRNS